MLNEHNFGKKCEARGLKCRFGAGVIYINSAKSNWRILHRNGKIYKVLHENYRGIQYNNGNFKSGFHEQKLWNFQVDNILDYIEKHDKCFLQPKMSDYDRMLERAKRQKFEVV